MKNVIIYHNPRCSKSRNAVKYLENKGEKFEVIDYFKNPISEEQLISVIEMLGINAEDLVRKGEPEFKEHFRKKKMTERDWVKAMVEFPKLIERPIVIKNGKAVIARPEDRIDELI